MQRFQRYFLLVAALVCFSATQAQNPAKPIVDEMMKAMDRIHSMSGRVKRLERINGEMVEGEMRFKAMFTPSLKIYIYNYKPDEGAELLFVKGWNDDQAYVHPNKFPWVNISLDPEGDVLTDGNHHSLYSLGFAYTREVVGHVFAKYGHEFDKHVFYEGKRQWYSHTTHVVKILYQDYKFENYTVKAGETLFDIDRKLKVPAAKIVELNPGINGYDDVKAGQVIKVPNVYAKETTLLIDTETYLPLVQIISDDKGLFEKYEYHEIKINPKFSTAEFTEDYPDYGF